MKLFLIELKYFNDYTDKEENEAALVFGDNFAEAVKNIQTSFDYISDMAIKIICDDCTPNVLYLPKEYKNFIQEIDDANNY